MERKAGGPITADNCFGGGPGWSDGEKNVSRNVQRSQQVNEEDLSDILEF